MKLKKNFMLSFDIILFQWKNVYDKVKSAVCKGSEGRSSALKRKPVELEDHMLHGPFNFKAHRVGVKQEKTSSNLRPELANVVSQAG